MSYGVVVWVFQINIRVDGQADIHLAGNEEGLFGVDPESGILYLNRPLDREKQAFYTLQVWHTPMAQAPSHLISLPHDTSPSCLMPLSFVLLEVNIASYGWRKPKDQILRPSLSFYSVFTLANSHGSQ